MIATGFPIDVCAEKIFSEQMTKKQNILKRFRNYQRLNLKKKQKSILKLFHNN